MKKQKYIYYLKDSKGKILEHFRHKLTAVKFLAKFKRENSSEKDSYVEGSIVQKELKGGKK